mgnify:CR=1 FL=1
MTKKGDKRIVMGPGWSGILETRDKDGTWRQTAVDKWHFDMIDNLQGGAEFYVPKRQENRRLPQVKRRSTPSQADPETLERFANAATDQGVLAQARDVDSFSGATHRALINYRSEGYKRINRQLHDGGDGDAGIDDAMSQTQLDGDAVVWRGGRNGAKRFASAWQLGEGSMIGVEYRDLAYASTSVDPSIALAFAGVNDEGFLIKILAPRGTRGVILTSSNMTNGEDELLLDRGLTYRIVGDHIEHGVRTFDVEVIG